MVNKLYVKAIIEVTLFSLISFLALVYSLLILLVRVCHNQNNMFILNICFNMINTSVYFIILYIYLYFDPLRLADTDMCILRLYVYNIASIGIPFAFVAFSVHRLCSLVYQANRFFKTKQWVGICIASQWIAVFILSLPFVFRKGPVCFTEIWMSYYTCIMAVFVPSVINIILNILIFVHVRSSSRRVQPQTVNAVTNGNNVQHVRLNHRDLSLLRQMTFMFTMFIGGWSPVYLSVLISDFVNTDILVIPVTVIFSELCILCIIINLFIRNHELRQYLLNKIRQFFRQRQL